MKYIIKVAMGYGDGSMAPLGYIASIKYGFIEKAARGEVGYIDKYGDIAINKMFKLEKKSAARVYNTQDSVEKDITLLKRNFNGLHYFFLPVQVSDNDARLMRSHRK